MCLDIRQSVVYKRTRGKVLNGVQKNPQVAAKGLKTSLELETTSLHESILCKSVNWKVSAHQKFTKHPTLQSQIIVSVGKDDGGSLMIGAWFTGWESSPLYNIKDVVAEAALQRGTVKKLLLNVLQVWSRATERNGFKPAAPKEDQPVIISKGSLAFSSSTVNI